MRKFRISLFVIVALILSMSVSASALGDNAYAEPSFVVYAGYSGFEVNKSDVAYTAADMIALFDDVTIESTKTLKPDKLELRFTYLVFKPTKTAKMQNQNFDRVNLI